MWLHSVSESFLIIILLITTMITSLNGRKNDKQSSLTTISNCFYAEPILCMQQNQLSQCNCNPHPTKPMLLVCCNITDIRKAILCADKSNNWKNIHIRNATLNELDVSNKFWKRFESVMITDGKIQKISNEFQKFSTINCLNMSNNNIIDINPNAFKNLTHLRVLDLSLNNLSTLPNITNLQLKLINISGNNAILCKYVIELIDNGFKFAKPNLTFCLTNNKFDWFDSIDIVAISQLEKKTELITECPSIAGFGNCTCTPERMDYEMNTITKNKTVVFTAKVDCSSLGLTELPDTLPTNTLTLNVSNNKIKNLSAFNANQKYGKIIRLYADNNQISSIEELEATNFIAKFEVLDLRWNNLKSIPTYILSTLGDQVKIYLEGNKLHCNCNSAKVLKAWLLNSHKNVRNSDRILCENMPEKVLELSELKLCQIKHEWIDYINYLIAFEVFLIIALIMKVNYDYYKLKTAGYLPWPASVIPKLPCDCFFEK